MGLLTEGSPLSWNETKKHADHVREHGINQFINIYHRLKDRSNDCLKWGDEVEYMMVKLDHKQQKARLVLKSEKILPKLQAEEREKPKENAASWMPEYAAYMIEGTPAKPYGHLVAHFNMVEANMRKRRKQAMRYMEDDEAVLSLVSFPRMGCGNFTSPLTQPTPTVGSSGSLFFSDDCIYQGHPRYRTLTRNIRERKGKRVVINIPVYKDENTVSDSAEFFASLGDDGQAADNSLPDHIYGDCMGFGMGMSCLQMTFQASNIMEAYYLYDQLAPLSPIMLALSANNPYFRGQLSDNDCRWNIIAASVDDRTSEELGKQPLKNDRFVISKSRYDSIDSYLSVPPTFDNFFNDVELTHDESIYEKLKKEGIPHLLSKHIAHLFIRDPISLFEEKIHLDDSIDSDHFENIQSTNWQTMRFKPPPASSPIGWRVEFRATEAQITDFENAAFVVFIVMLTRVIATFKLMFVIPISKVDKNMQRAHKRDAVLNEKFYFRKDIAMQLCGESCNKTEDLVVELTIDEIINGKGDDFPGLMPLIYKYLNSLDDCDVDTRCSIEQYLRLIQKRASGQLMTGAHWQRDFILNHEDYKKDSHITEKINYDLVRTLIDITNGDLRPDSLLPAHSTMSSMGIPGAKIKAENKLCRDGKNRITPACETNQCVQAECV